MPGEFVPMLDLEGIVARWKAVAEAAPVDKHPTVWVAHYGTSTEALFDRITQGPQARTNELLGSLYATDPNNAGNAVLFLAAPWSTVAEVHECIVIVDIFRTLHITQFVDEGPTQYSTDWRVPYRMDDDGTLVFEVATKQPSAVWSACQMLWENRTVGKGKHEFHQAFNAAKTMGEHLL